MVGCSTGRAPPWTSWSGAARGRAWSCGIVRGTTPTPTRTSRLRRWAYSPMPTLATLWRSHAMAGASRRSRCRPRKQFKAGMWRYSGGCPACACSTSRTARWRATSGPWRNCGIWRYWTCGTPRWPETSPPWARCRRCSLSASVAPARRARSTATCQTCEASRHSQSSTYPPRWASLATSLPWRACAIWRFCASAERRPRGTCPPWRRCRGSARRASSSQGSSAISAR
mmetsp:Transcript_35054/g.100963  ORF Transcript_35054/g.100963 Transcript_35054/m.100963 type:complete len:228 (-) Transcript_35054:8-691(-)